MSTFRILLPFGLLVLLAACGGPRKACRKAEGMVARAVMKCPELAIAKERVDTITVVVPGHAGSGEGQYDQADIDSLLTICNDLVRRAQERSWGNRQALLAARDSLAAKSTKASAADVVARFRASVCVLEPVVVDNDTITLRIWTKNGRMGYWYYVKPQFVKQAVTTVSQQVVPGSVPCPPEGVASWYRTFFWCFVVAASIAAFLLLRSMFIGSARAWKIWTIAIALTCATQTNAQTDSLAKAHERTWMQPATDGKLWHDLPPPANLVNAGGYLLHAGNMGQSALWTAITCGAVGALFYKQNADVSHVLWIAGGGFTIYFGHRHNRALRRGGTFLQSGYRIDQRYEIVPDSIAPGPHLRIVPIK